MFLKISLLICFVINSYDVWAESSNLKLSDYDSFMKLIETDSNKYHDGCLLGEFTFSYLDYFKIPDYCPQTATYAKFIINFNEATIIRDLNTFRKISNDFRKFTLSCYIQFHHLRSYRYEYQWASKDKGDPNLKLDYKNKNLSFLKILGDSNNFYDTKSEFFSPWLLQLSPTFIILYHSTSSLKRYPKFADKIFFFPG